MMIQKKHLYLTAIVAAWGFSCQNQSVNESMATDSQNAMPPVENIEAFTRFPMSTKKICNPAANQACAQDIQQLNARLASLNIIPIPKESERLSLSVEQATERYKGFLTAHKGEPIASVFRQVYASAILNRYGVLDDQDYELIKFFTAELADENSLDFATLAKAANVLQGKLSASDYANLVSSTTERALEQQKANQEFAGQLATMAKKKTAKGDETPEAIAARIQLTQLNKSTLSSDVKQLSRLQQTVRQ